MGWRFVVEPIVSEEFYRIFPARKRTPEKWAGSIKKRSQEVARYILPIGTFAHLSPDAPHRNP